MNPKSQNLHYDDSSDGFTSGFSSWGTYLISGKVHLWLQTVALVSIIIPLQHYKRSERQFSDWPLGVSARPPLKEAGSNAAPLSKDQPQPKLQRL